MIADPTTQLGKRESIRIFKNGLMEKLTFVHPSVPLIIYIPIVILCLNLWDFGNHRSAIIGLLLTGAGLISWLITEYVLHRTILHWEPKSRLGKRLHFIFHGVHHDDPQDGWRLVMPPSASIPLCILFFSLFGWLLGTPTVYPFFAGFVGGYLIYDMIHYAVHHFPLRGKVGRYLKIHHMSHHFRDDERAYGVSSPLFDLIFGTMPTKRTEPNQATMNSGPSMISNSSVS